jgi:hypothetical protein
MGQLPDVCLRRRGFGKSELSGMAAQDNVFRLAVPLIRNPRMSGPPGLLERTKFTRRPGADTLSNQPSRICEGDEHSLLKRDSGRLTLGLRGIVGPRVRNSTTDLLHQLRHCVMHKLRA